MDRPIEIFAPGLPHTPGWNSLSTKDRDWLLEHTSNAISNFRQSGLKAIQCCAELALVQNYLEGKPMSFTRWVDTIFTDEASARTAWRWLKNYKEMRGSATDQAILYLAERGITGLNNIGQREILTAVKKLPPPKTTDKKQLEAWTGKVGETVRELRRIRHKRPKLSEDDAIKVGATTLVRLLREAQQKTSAEQKAFLKRLISIVMELRAISGTLAVERSPIPEGFMPKRGRPRLKPEP